MAPTVILIRHAEAVHNDYSLCDPGLSDLGFQQAEELQQALQGDLPLAQDVDLIVVSPMRRTLQTALVGLKWLIDKGVPVQVRGEWQENGLNTCDIGRPVEVLSEEFPSLDFSTVFPEWPSKTGRWAQSQEAIAQRGKDCRTWLRGLPEKVIAVVSHSGFLREGVSHCAFANSDYRIFDFSLDGGDELVEHASTRDRGGGRGMSKKGSFGFAYQGFATTGSSNTVPPADEK